MSAQDSLRSCIFPCTLPILSTALLPHIYQRFDQMDNCLLVLLLHGMRVCSHKGCPHSTSTLACSQNTSCSSCYVPSLWPAPAWTMSRLEQATGFVQFRQNLSLLCRHPIIIKLHVPSRFIVHRQQVYLGATKNTTRPNRDTLTSHLYHDVPAGSTPQPASLAPAASICGLQAYAASICGLGDAAGDRFDVQLQLGSGHVPLRVKLGEWGDS